VAPNREAKGVSPRASRGSRAFPKRKLDQARAMSWQCSVRKLSIVSSIRTRFGPRLAGSRAVDDLQGVVFFSIFISPIFVVAHFEWANKILIM